MAMYKVKQGDCLRRIACEHGLPWRKIYDDSGNVDLRERRPDPHVLNPGDRLFIPERELGDESGATEQRHTFRLKNDPVTLRIILKDKDGEPLPDEPFRLQVEAREPVEDSTTEEGLIEVPIRPDDERAKLTVWVEDLNPDLPATEQHFLLRLGWLDPVTETKGIQARLENLGFEPGPVDGILGPLTKRAIRKFQGDSKDLKVDGIAGPKTQAKLAEAHTS